MAAKATEAKVTSGAIANAALIWLALGAILVETLRRLADPAPVAGGTMMLVAAIGIVVNGASAMLFAAGRSRDINLRAAFQHLMADAAVSANDNLNAVLWIQTSAEYRAAAETVYRAAADGALRALRQTAPFDVPQGFPGGAYRPTFNTERACRNR